MWKREWQTFVPNRINVKMLFINWRVGFIYIHTYTLTLQKYENEKTDKQEKQKNHGWTRLFFNPSAMKEEKKKKTRIRSLIYIFIFFAKTAKARNYLRVIYYLEVWKKNKKTIYFYDNMKTKNWCVFGNSQFATKLDDKSCIILWSPDDNAKICACTHTCVQRTLLCGHTNNTW